MASHQFNCSQRLKAPLTALILPVFSNTFAMELNNITVKVKAQQKRELDWSSEKGVSNWPAVLPLNEKGFSLHKGAYHDALCLLFGWQPPHIPSNWQTVEHALGCSHGGFPHWDSDTDKFMRGNLVNGVIPQKNDFRKVYLHQYACDRDVLRQARYLLYTEYSASALSRGDSFLLRKRSNFLWGYEMLVHKTFLTTPM